MRRNGLLNTRILNVMQALEDANDTITVRKLCRVLGKQPSVMDARLRKLRDAGYVDWVPGKSGTLHLVRRIGFTLAELEAAKRARMAKTA
jgi:DNA-binding IscR family transcriptional regulator